MEATHRESMSDSIVSTSCPKFVVVRVVLFTAQSINQSLLFQGSGPCQAKPAGKLQWQGMLSAAGKLDA